MRAYYFDELPGDQRLPHDSGMPASNAALASIGVLLWHVPIPTSTASNYAEVDAIAHERDYKTIETMAVTKEALGDVYEQSLKVFFSECVSEISRLGSCPSVVLNIILHRHMHEDEEIRYILEGGGFFDVHGRARLPLSALGLASYSTVFGVVENATNRWIRFLVNAGDLVLLPAGIYHRFTLDDRNIIKARMFFKVRSPCITHSRIIDLFPRTDSSGYLTTGVRNPTTTHIGWNT